MPEQVPLLLIGRRAIDQDFQGMGLGTELLADALRRCVAASEVVGMRGILAHAIDEEAARYYERHDFLRSPLGERAMLMPIETARAIVELAAVAAFLEQSLPNVIRIPETVCGFLRVAVL